MSGRQCSLSFKSASPDDVLKVINGLKKINIGIDNIDTWVIKFKLVAHEILPAVTHIINLSILQ